MNIWIIFSLIVVACASSEEEGKSNDVNNLKTLLSENEFGSRPVYPFDAFGFGFDRLFSKWHPPMLGGMNKFIPSSEQEKSENKNSSDENSKLSSTDSSLDVKGSRETEKSISEASLSHNGKKKLSASSQSDVSSDKKPTVASNYESSAISSETASESKHDTESKSESKSESDSKSSSLSSEKTIELSSSAEFRGDIAKSSLSTSFEKEFDPNFTESSGEVTAESQIISSGEKPIVSRSSEKIESVIEMASVSNRNDEDVQHESSSVGSADLVFDSTQEIKEKELSQETSSKSVQEEIDYLNSKSISESVSSDGYSQKSSSSSSSSVSETIYLESDSSKSSASSSSSVSETIYLESDSSKSSGSSSFSVSETYSKSDSVSQSSESSRTMESADIIGSVCPVDEVCEPDPLDTSASENYEYQIAEIKSDDFLQVRNRLTIADIRGQLEESYTNLAFVKKRASRKEIAVRDLNQVIGELESLCDKVCKELHSKYQ